MSVWLRWECEEGGKGATILWDCTTVIIQLRSLFFSVKRPWYHYHLMNIYNWILAAASLWSDEYYSLFIQPLRILFNSASITAVCGAVDDDGDHHHHHAVNSGKLKLSVCSLNVWMIKWKVYLKNNNNNLGVSGQVVLLSLFRSMWKYRSDVKMTSQVIW